MAEYETLTWGGHDLYRVPETGRTFTSKEDLERYLRSRRRGSSSALVDPKGKPLPATQTDTRPVPPAIPGGEPDGTRTHSE